MILCFSEKSWSDYLYWQTQDKKTLKRVNLIIKDTKRNPVTGLGKPEPLKNNLTGYWSRRISKEHRIVYKVENNTITIVSMRFHYE